MVVITKVETFFFLFCLVYNIALHGGGQYECALHVYAALHCHYSRTWSCEGILFTTESIGTCIGTFVIGLNQSSFLLSIYSYNIISYKI